MPSPTRFAHLPGALLALAFAASCGCPALPPDQFCFQWPVPDQVAAVPGPCPAPDKVSLTLEADGTDATGAAIEDAFKVLGPGDTRAGECCYWVRQTPPCP
jgi:hypothetical protein